MPAKAVASSCGEQVHEYLVGCWYHLCVGRLNTKASPRTRKPPPDPVATHQHSLDPNLKFLITGGASLPGYQVDTDQAAARRVGRYRSGT
jgi:hypothetical protein